MAEVIDWSPVDESNNSPPPVGAPEHHAPSAVNNIMRAMMGSIRRWYDSVTTQLANTLKLTGGTVTGNTSFNGPLGISIQGTWLDGDGAGNLVVRNVASGSNAGAVLSVGYGAAFLFSDRDMVSPSWGWSANAGTAAFGRFSDAAIITISGAGVVTVTGNITASGYVDAATLRGNYILSDGNIDATATLNAAHIVSSGDINATGSIYAGVNLDAEGILQAGSIQSLGAITAAGNITAGGNFAAANITATGQVTGAYLYSTGAIHANGAIDSDTNISADGNITAGGTVTGNAVTANAVNATNITGESVVGTTSLATRDAVGDITCGMYTSGTVSYLQFLNQASNANRWEFNGTNGDLQYRSLNVVQWVMRRSLDTMCFNALGPVGGNGAYYNSSDSRFKANIEPSLCGLAEIVRLRPVEFERIGCDNDREIGFIAQDVEDVIPAAVRIVGIPLPDGGGGSGSANPTLGVDTTPIIAALCNAMKEISERISVLEGKRHE